MKALITGAAGLLGQELAATLPGATSYSHRELDITDETQLWRVVTNRKVDVVYNCAGMTNVDECERQPARARLINAVAPRCLASICASLGIYLITISTDYVFDGKLGQILDENAPTKPVSVYGRTKREGEVGVLDVNPNAAIVRTSWLYGKWRPTFTELILGKAAQGQPFPISSNQISSPTWVHDLAPALVRLSSRKPSGIFHLVGEGAVSRSTWAQEALNDAGYDPDLVEGVTDYPAPARRPKYSALTNRRARELGITLPPWQDSVRTYISSLTGAGEIAV